MPRRSITPLEFASLIPTAQSIRGEGFSKVQSAVSACVQANIDEAWAMPLLSFINDSPAAAEAWAREQHEDALARAFNKMEQQS